MDDELSPNEPNQSEPEQSNSPPPMPNPGDDGYWEILSRTLQHRQQAQRQNMEASFLAGTPLPYDVNRREQSQRELQRIQEEAENRERIERLRQQLENSLRLGYPHPYERFPASMQQELQQMRDSQLQQQVGRNQQSSSSDYNFQIYEDAWMRATDTNKHLSKEEPLDYNPMETHTKRTLYNIMEKRLNKEYKYFSSNYHQSMRPAVPYDLSDSVQSNRPIQVLPFKIQEFVPLSSVMNKAINSSTGGSINYQFNYILKKFSQSYRRTLSESFPELLFCGLNMNPDGYPIISPYNKFIDEYIAFDDFTNALINKGLANSGRNFLRIMAYYAQQSKKTMMTHGFLPVMIDFNWIKSRTSSSLRPSSWMSYHKMELSGKNGNVEVISFQDGNFYNSSGKLIASLFVTNKKYEQLLHAVYNIYNHTRGSSEHKVMNVNIQGAETFLVIEEGPEAEFFMNYDLTNPALKFFNSISMLDDQRSYSGQFNFALTKDIIRFITGQQIKVRKAYEVA